MLCSKLLYEKYEQFEPVLNRKYILWIWNDRKEGETLEDNIVAAYIGIFCECVINFDYSTSFVMKVMTAVRKMKRYYDVSVNYR